MPVRTRRVVSRRALGDTPASTQPSGDLPVQPTYLQNGLEVFADGSPVPGGYNALVDYYSQTGTTPGVVNATVQQLVQTNPTLVNGLPSDAQTLINRTLNPTSSTTSTSTAAAASTTIGGLSLTTWLVIAGAGATAWLVFGRRRS